MTIYMSSTPMYHGVHMAMCLKRPLIHEVCRSGQAMNYPAELMTPDATK